MIWSNWTPESVQTGWQYEHIQSCDSCTNLYTDHNHVTWLKVQELNNRCSLLTSRINQPLDFWMKITTLGLCWNLLVLCSALYFSVHAAYFRPCWIVTQIGSVSSKAQQKTWVTNYNKFTFSFMMEKTQRGTKNCTQIQKLKHTEQL